MTPSDKQLLQDMATMLREHDVFGGRKDRDTAKLIESLMAMSCERCKEFIEDELGCFCKDCAADAREGLAVRASMSKAIRRNLTLQGLLRDALDALEPFARADRLSASTAGECVMPKIQPGEFVSIEDYRDAASARARIEGLLREIADAE